MHIQTTHENRLIHEQSPYLLQHAHNPVDWYPWGDEAFAKATAEDKPVFLSIGYSTCHWCHVMGRESFEDQNVADILNQHFVSIKVDREERPDIDDFYMEACVAFSGSGGWPLSCFLTPDRKPFYTGTYFPKHDLYGSVGFLSLINKIAELWNGSRPELVSASASLTKAVSAHPDFHTTGEIDPAAAVSMLKKSFDTEYGGFGREPKFPSLQNIVFLMLYGSVYNDHCCLDMAAKTLDCMRSGGIYDHIGGGFFRYSTDRNWLIPHFEKMMIDNAMHILAYSLAGSIIDQKYLSAARDTAAFCLNEMLGPEGGFYTATDADSKSGEGGFYTFTPDEIYQVLGIENGKKYCGQYDITTAGNFEGKSIPNLIRSHTAESDVDFLRHANHLLYEYRLKRDQVFKDDKSLASINGLMAAALSVLGRITGDGRLIAHAERCAEFVLERMVSGGRMYTSFRGGKAVHPASCDDYAYFVYGCTELYQSTYNPTWLEHAIEYSRKLDELFWDGTSAGYFTSGSDLSDLPFRLKSLQDGALPSGNSIAVLNLLRLSYLCANPEYTEKADAVIRQAAGSMQSYPIGNCGMYTAWLYEKVIGTQTVFVNGNGLDQLMKALPYDPFGVSILCGNGYESITDSAPFTREYKRIGDKATAYLCSGGTCTAPVNSPEDLRTVIAGIRKQRADKARR